MFGYEELNSMDIIAEFMATQENSEKLLIIGDKIDDDTANDIIVSFKKANTELNTVKLNTTELFKGECYEQLMDERCAVFLDSELSGHIINIITKNEHEVDELDVMLLNKYIIKTNQKKYIFDLSECPQTKINQLIKLMDLKSKYTNYIFLENIMGIQFSLYT